MASTYMLRFPRSDAQDAYVLVQAASTGSHPLDIKLVGTDGADPYAFSCKYACKKAPCLLSFCSHRPVVCSCSLVRGPLLPALMLLTVRADRISKYREKSGPCTDEEWESILTAVLTDQEAVEDVEVTARVHSESQIEITFKKKIEQFSVCCPMLLNLTIPGLMQT